MYKLLDWLDDNKQAILSYIGWTMIAILGCLIVLLADIAGGIISYE